MKKYILPFMSIAMLMAMASCSSSDDEVTENKEESKLVQMTFTATQETNTDTRTALSDAGNYVIWKKSDAISVFYRRENQSFTLVGDGGYTSGSFTGTASSDATQFTAVYPYTDGARNRVVGMVYDITLPAEQTATKGSFDPKAALMMAVSTTDKKYKLDFKNAVSLVKITTDFACKQIVLSANENIAGTGSLNYNDGEPSITFTSNKSKTVTLKPAIEGGVIAAGTYYIAICPHTSTGFSISFINSADTKAYTRASSKENKFYRSKIKNLGAFSESGTSWNSTIESNGKVKASQQVDMGVFTIGDKSYRLIFAKSNLTDTGLAEKETDYGDYFAWGATEPWYSSLSGNTFTWKDSYQTGYTSTSYDTHLNGKSIEENNVLIMDYDTANKKLNGEWRIPTQAIWDKFINGCTAKGWKWTEIASGYEFTNNNQTLFLPAAGQFDGINRREGGSIGYYWSGTATSSTTALHLSFSSSSASAPNIGSSRTFGHSVRPVRLVEVSQPQQ